MTEQNLGSYPKPLRRNQSRPSPLPPSHLIKGLGGHHARHNVSPLMTSPKGLIVTLPAPFPVPSQDILSFVENALPSVSKRELLPEHLFWEPAWRGENKHHIGRHSTAKASAPQRWEVEPRPGEWSLEETDPSKVGRGCSPGFLWPATGRRHWSPASSGGRPGCVGMSHTLVRFPKEGILLHIDSQPVFPENCGEGAIFKPSLEFKC